MGTSTSLHGHLLVGPKSGNVSAPWSNTNNTTNTLDLLRALDDAELELYSQNCLITGALDTRMVSVKVHDCGSLPSFIQASERLHHVVSVALQGSVRASVKYEGLHDTTVIRGSVHLLAYLSGRFRRQMERGVLHVDIPFMDLNSPRDAHTFNWALQSAIKSFTQPRQAAPGVAERAPDVNITIATQPEMCILPIAVSTAEEGENGVVASGITLLLPAGEECERVRVVVVHGGLVVADTEAYPVRQPGESRTALVRLRSVVPAVTQTSLLCVHVLPVRPQGAATPAPASLALLVLPRAAAWEVQRYFDSLLAHEGGEGDMDDARRRVYSHNFWPFCMALGRCLVAPQHADLKEAEAVLYVLLRDRMLDTAAMLLSRLVGSGTVVHGLQRDTFSHEQLVAELQGLLDSRARLSALQPSADALGSPSARQFTAAVAPPELNLATLLHSALVGFCGPGLEPAYLAWKASRSFALDCSLSLWPVLAFALCAVARHDMLLLLLNPAAGLLALAAAPLLLATAAPAVFQAQREAVLLVVISACTAWWHLAPWQIMAARSGAPGVLTWQWGPLSYTLLLPAITRMRAQAQLLCSAIVVAPQVLACVEQASAGGTGQAWVQARGAGSCALRAALLLAGGATAAAAFDGCMRATFLRSLARKPGQGTELRGRRLSVPAWRFTQG